MFRERPNDFHEEDLLLIAEALVTWSGPPEKVETKKQERAYQLVEAIAYEIDVSLNELRVEMETVDHDLTPPH